MQLKYNLLLLSVLPYVISHQEDGMDDEMPGMSHNQVTQSIDPDVLATVSPIPHVMHHQHGVPILQTNLLPEELAYWQNYNTTSYFSYPDSNKTSLYLYISMFVICFIFVNPVLMAINNVNEQSLAYLFGLFVNSIGVLFGLLNYSIFMGSIPDLYPGNVFNKFNWIYLFTIPGQFIMALFKLIHLRNGNTLGGYNHVSDDDDENVNSPSITLYDLSRNASPDSFELNNHHHDDINTVSSDRESRDLESNLHNLNLHLNKLQTNSFNSIFAKLSNNPFVIKFGNTCTILFNLLNWFNFLFFLVYLPTGVATFGLFGKGNTVFNLLAHFIKGGVFFALGIVSLARYCGAWSDKGFAWNYKFIYSSDKLSRWQKFQPIGLITMEGLECFLIFFYGSTNVFLEHLANPGGEWSAKDLEHASIAFIFIGCGLCGLITESKLSTWRFNYSSCESKSVSKSSPGFSPNPFPLMCIFWTGILMSKHQQASEMSTAVHTQWGNLLAYGACFRFLTYVLNLLLPKPLDLTQPTRPITELVVSFALLSGGLIFMESCDPVILALEYRGLGAMFTLNVFVGITFLLMSWIMLVFQIKSWFSKRYQ